MQPLIDVRDLRYRYPDGTLALDGVSFQLWPGETVAVFGANGSGKTTFVLHLNGLLDGEGLVSVCGMRVSKETLPSSGGKSGWFFKIPMSSYSCRPFWRMSPLARLTWG